MLLEIVLRVIFTGVTEGAQCRRVPWPLRIILLLFVVIIYGGVGVLLLFCAWNMHGEPVWLRLFCLGGGGMCLFYVGNHLRKAIRK